MFVEFIKIIIERRIKKDHGGKIMLVSM